MIEHLEGTHETVNYRTDTLMRIYDNVEDEEYPSHWHTAVEVIMPLENDYRVEYEGNELTMQEGDILFLCPGALHHLFAKSGERYIMQFELASIGPLRSVDSLLTFLYPGIYISPENAPDTHPQMRSLVEKIMREYKNSPPLYDISIYADVLNMLTLLGREHTTLQKPIAITGGKQKEYMTKFMDICTYINEHCTEDLTLEQVAARTGFSKYHFSRLFKEFTNKSFYRYLNQRRIEHAEKLLLDPTMSITDVSISSGFTSLSSFIRMFKIIKGCTPSAFKAMKDWQGVEPKR